MTDNLYYLDGKTYLLESTGGPLEINAKAAEFFWRAELSETLTKIWETIKRQRVGTMLKLAKAAALVAGVILLSHSISFSGLLALPFAIGGLLIAAISNVLVWLLYVPLYFVKPSDFASSALLALGLTWLTGISPLIALVFSPMILFGLRLVEQSPLVQKPVGELIEDIAHFVEQVADNITNTIRGILLQPKQPELIEG